MVDACGGSWMVKSGLLRNREFGRISTLCASAMSTMLGFAVRPSDSLTEQLSDLREKQRATREVTIGTNFVERAAAYFTRCGLIRREQRSDSNAANLVQVRLTVPDSDLTVVLEPKEASQ